jgi:hypothetical protein
MEYPRAGEGHEELQLLVGCAGMLMTGARYTKASATTIRTTASASLSLNGQVWIRGYIHSRELSSITRSETGGEITR